MNTTYTLVFRSETTPRKVILAESNQTITATFFYGSQYLAHKTININQFQNTLSVLEKWLGGMRITAFGSKFRVASVASSNYPSPIIRWD